MLLVASDEAIAAAFYEVALNIAAGAPAPQNIESRISNRKVSPLVLQTSASERT